ncbi:hypothetical protein [Halogeometricum borinquense]|uniref:hypothetical protein n=1 Tax=Halogeometricum borinquense TaxID=60847 RepID=UPI0034312E58
MATCRDDEAFVRELDGDAGDASLAMWPRRKRNGRRTVGQPPLVWMVERRTGGPDTVRAVRYGSASYTY